MSGVIPPISSVTPLTGAGAVDPAQKSAPSGFADKIGSALQDASAAERRADLMAQDVAQGGPTPIHELMVATTKATLTVEMLTQVRNRAIQAYQEVMQMQV